MLVWQHVLALFLSLLIHSSQKSALYNVQQQAGDPVWKLHGTNYELAFYSQEDDSDARDKEELWIVHSDQGSVLGLGVKKLRYFLLLGAGIHRVYPDPSELQHSSVNTPNRGVCPASDYGWSTKLKTYSYISAGVCKMWDSGLHCSSSNRLSLHCLGFPGLFLS